MLDGKFEAAAQVVAEDETKISSDREVSSADGSVRAGRPAISDRARSSQSVAVGGDFKGDAI